MQQRGGVVMQSRAGLLQPVRVDPRKPRAIPAASKAPRTGESRQMGPASRMAEHQGIGDTGDRPPPHLRHGHPPDLATRRQMLKDLQERHDAEMGMRAMGLAGGMARPRGSLPRPMMVPVDKLPPDMARQLQQGPITLHLGPPPVGHFPPVMPRHFTSKSSEPMRHGHGTPHTAHRGVAAMAHLASPLRVSSSPTGVSPREHPGVASPRELHPSSPRTLANTRSTSPRGFAEDMPSPRHSSDVEKSPRYTGKQEGGWKASPRLSAEPPNSPRGTLAPGDAAAPEGRRGVPRDRGDEKLLQNLNLKATEKKGSRAPDRSKLPTAVPASEPNKAPNEATTGRVVQQGNPHVAGGAAIYQMERKGQFGRGAAAGPPHRDLQGVSPGQYGAKPGQYPGPQHQQIPTMPSPKIRASADNPRMASQKKPPTVLVKKTTLSASKPPPGFSPALLVTPPATSPTNSPRPSLIITETALSKNTERSTDAASASPGSSPTTVPKPSSPRNSPARTYVITPRDSPTALPAAQQKTPARSPQATSAANVSRKLQMDAAVLQTTTSTATGKDRKGKYQNPKTRLSAGGDLHTAKGRAKTSHHGVGAGEAPSPPGEKSAAAPTVQTQPSREENEPLQQTDEPSDFNKGQLPAKASPLVRKSTKTSMLPVLNLSPRSPISQHLPEEEQGKSGNMMAKQTEGTPRKTNAGEGNKRMPPPAKNRKGGITGPAHTEGAREVPRGKASGGKQRRGKKESIDVAAALPDTSGNYASAVHQWLRQSHYKVIQPHQYRKHETIQEESVKQTGLGERGMTFKVERPPKPATPEAEKAAPQPPAPPPPDKDKEKDKEKDKDKDKEKAGRRGRAAAPRCGGVPRSLSPLSRRYQPSAEAPRPLRRAPLSLLMMKQKDAVPKMAAAAVVARAGKKASKAAAGVASVESARRKTAPKKGTPRPAPAKARGTRRKKDKEKGAKVAARPRVGPAGDSGDLSSTEGSSYLSASDEANNEQTAMC